MTTPVDPKDWALYDEKVLPAGPWGEYEPRDRPTVYAMRVLGPFRFKDPQTGLESNYPEGWIVQHRGGRREALTASEFASKYRPNR